MSEDTKKNIRESVFNDENFKQIYGKLSAEEQAKVCFSLDEFINTVAVPLVEGMEEALKSPEVLAELKKRLGNSAPELLKK